MQARFVLRDWLQDDGELLPIDMAAGITSSRFAGDRDVDDSGKEAVGSDGEMIGTRRGKDVADPSGIAQPGLRCVIADGDGESQRSA
jgi:hypothetical protein